MFGFLHPTSFAPHEALKLYMDTKKITFNIFRSSCSDFKFSEFVL